MATRTGTDKRRSAASGPGETPEQLPTGERPALDRGLRLLGLLVLAGTFLGTADTWGFDHLAYLPRWAPALMLPPVAFLFLRHGPHAPLAGERSRLHDRLFVWRPGLVVWPALAAASFALLRSRAHFLGDGYLLLDELATGSGLRPLESFGYVLLQRCRVVFGANADPSLAAYRAVSIAAGVVGLVLVRRLIAQTAWDHRQRLAFTGLYLCGAATLLYCGYVENYAFLFAFLTAFTLAGVAVAQGRAPIALPAILLAAAMAAHLNAVLAAPALMALAWSGPGGAGRRRRLVVATVPVLTVLLALAAYLVASGGGLAALTASLRDDPNLLRPLRPLAGAGGILSVRTLVDVANLVLLLAPVQVVMLLTRRRRARTAGPRDPVAGFLAVHASVVAAAAVLIDPKLGAARDWDLLAPHVSAVTALAVAVLPSVRLRPRRLAAAALAASLPWFALGLDGPAAAGRLAVVARRFPPYAQGYAFEGLGKFHRDAGRAREVAAMYLEATRSQPGNARFHALLGAAYVTLFNESDAGGAPREEFMEQAEASYRQAQRLQPGYPPVLDNLARLCVRKNGFAEAESLLNDLAGRQPLSAFQLTLLLYCQYRLDQTDQVARTRARIRALDPTAEPPADWPGEPPVGAR